MTDPLRAAEEALEYSRPYLCGVIAPHMVAEALAAIRAARAAKVTAPTASADRQSEASASRRENSNDQGGEKPPPPVRASVPADREALAQLMIKHGFASGHGDTHADLIAEFDAQLTESRLSSADGWRPIENAPKDGTRILVWRPRAVIFGCTYIGHVGKDRWVDGNWWESRRGQQPSHWRPLPSPPSSDTEEM